MQKNVASQKVIVYAYNKLTGAAVTSDSGNFAKVVSKDGAALGGGGGSFTELSLGYYVYAPTTAETNCDLFLLVTTSSTANVVIDDVVIYTRVDDSIETKLDTVDGIVDNILVDTGTTLDAAIAAVKVNVDAILVDTSMTLDGKINTIDTIVDSILVDTGTTLDGKIDVIDAIVDSILLDTNGLYDGTGVDGKTIVQALRIIAAAVSGRVSGAGTGTETFLGMDEATTRLTVSVDSDGNRSDVTYG